MKKFLKMIQAAYGGLERFYLELLDRSRYWGSERRPIFHGRWPGEPAPVIDGPHNARPRRSKEPWTPTQLMLIVIVLGFLVAIALLPNWTVLYR